ncbi:MAG: hypothetical protein JST14_11690, partial [Bacteroidetes bacterium]|nr:hypothetical protein [Bacteroidota bacterium]
MPTFRDPDLKKQFETGVSPGFNVSGLINFSLKKRYSFQSEFGYTMTGRRVTFGSDQWTNASTYQFLDFAMMLRR